MFEGEMASLAAILKTGTVKVPRPIKVLDAPGGGSVLVMEHLDMRYLSRSVPIPSSAVSSSVWLFYSKACTWGCHFEECDVM